MNCFNCGAAGSQVLCDNCCTEEILDNIFEAILNYNPETCKYSIVMDYIESLEDKAKRFDCIPEILELFSSEVSEYYFCRYYKKIRDDRFEPLAIKYLNVHNLEDIKTQKVLYDLLNYYLRNDFVKPNSWCKLIAGRDDLCLELYEKASEFYGMVAEYDISEQLADKGIEKCESGNATSLLNRLPENIIISLNKQKNLLKRYRSGKPYWPKTEKRRLAVAEIYDKKNIKYPRITKIPHKVKESDFSPIHECFEDVVDTYVSFWCEDAFCVVGIGGIYQIAGIKMQGNECIDEFQSYIRPWDNLASRKDAAKKAGISLAEMESKEDVDIVMSEFFKFAEDNILVSTGALGKQSKLISRAARYSGMNEIKNEFWDLLDFAADIDRKFDFEHNNREYLLNYFGIKEGTDALSKAKANIMIYEKLKEFGEHNE